jgi:hypothetical protein
MLFLYKEFFGKTTKYKPNDGSKEKLEFLINRKKEVGKR